MKISDVKFEEHFFYISRDTLCSAPHKSSRTTRDVITFPICTTVKRQHLQNKKRYSKKENVIITFPEKPVKQAAIIFHFIGTLN